VDGKRWNLVHLLHGAKRQSGNHAEKQEIKNAAGPKPRVNERVKQQGQARIKLTMIQPLHLLMLRRRNTSRFLTLCALTSTKRLTSSSKTVVLWIGEILMDTLLSW
jgi:hypothetical protein